MPARSGHSQRIGPPTWVVMRLPGMKTDPLKPPLHASTGPTGAALEQIDENISLAPPEGKSRAEVLAELTEPLKPEDLLDPFDGDEKLVPQFSLAELLFLMTAASVGLAGLRVLSPAPFAAAVGGLTFLFLWMTTVNGIRHRWVHVAGWGLLAIYLIAAGGALACTWQSA